jgi:hypothetical protein
MLSVESLINLLPSRPNVSGLVVGLLMLCTWPTEAATRRSMEIIADEVEAELTQAVTYFRRNVHISLNQYRIQCQQATIRLNSKTRQPEEITMQGQVVIESPEGTVRSKKATFTFQTNRLRLEGPVYSKIQILLPDAINP